MKFLDRLDLFSQSWLQLTLASPELFNLWSPLFRSNFELLFFRLNPLLQSRSFALSDNDQQRDLRIDPLACSPSSPFRARHWVTHLPRSLVHSRSTFPRGYVFHERIRDFIYDTNSRSLHIRCKYALVLSATTLPRTSIGQLHRHPSLPRLSRSRGRPPSPATAPPPPSRPIRFTYRTSARLCTLSVYI